MKKKQKGHILRPLAVSLAVLISVGVIGPAALPSTETLSVEAKSESTEEPEKEPEKTGKGQKGFMEEREEELIIKQAKAKPEVTAPCVISLKSVEPNFESAVRTGRKAAKTAQAIARDTAMKQAHEAADTEIQKEKEKEEEEKEAQTAQADESTAQQETDTAAGSQDTPQPAAPSSIQYGGTTYYGCLYIGGYAADVYAPSDPSMSPIDLALAQAVVDASYSCYYQPCEGYFADHNTQGFTEIIYNDTATWVKPDGSVQTLTKVWQGIGYNTDSLTYADGADIMSARYGTYWMYTCTGAGGDQIYITWWN